MFDITLDLLLMAWNFKDILRFVPGMRSETLNVKCVPKS